jgi:ER degradation enhancer, mannosidase alpha-like 3
LVAFWPGLQVLKGDIKGAIKMHETLHQIVKKHDFIPEAVLFDHSAHWSSYPLRPEFLESTYYLYRATNDDYYLEIAKQMLNQLEKYSRVKCGYAAIADVKTKQHEDRMDSFVYAETFKYLYLMFAEEHELAIDVDQFIFSTEAHLLPLNLAQYATKEVKQKLKDEKNKNKNKKSKKIKNKIKKDSKNPQWINRSCPSLQVLFQNKLDDETGLIISVGEATKLIRQSVTNVKLAEKCEKPNTYDIQMNFENNIKIKDKSRELPLRAADFVAGRKDHMNILKRLGVSLSTMSDGRVQLVHKTSDANNYLDAELGILFMTEMLELSKQSNFQLKTESKQTGLDEYRPVSLTIVWPPQQFNNNEKRHKSYIAGPSHFGYDLRSKIGIFGELTIAKEIDLCKSYEGLAAQATGRILIAKRGNCMFIDKARLAEKFGAIGLIIIDNIEDSQNNANSENGATLFAMSGDGVQDVSIPCIFLFGKDGNDLLWILRSYQNMIVLLGNYDAMNKNSNEVMSPAEVALNYEPNISKLKDIMSAHKKMSSLNRNTFLDVINSQNDKNKVIFSNILCSKKLFAS